MPYGFQPHSVVHRGVSPTPRRFLAAAVELETPATQGRPCAASRGKARAAPHLQGVTTHADSARSVTAR